MDYDILQAETMTKEELDVLDKILSVGLHESGVLEKPDGTPEYEVGTRVLSLVERINYVKEKWR